MNCKTILSVQLVGGGLKQSPARIYASAVLHDTGLQLFTQRHCCQFMELIYRLIKWIKAHKTLPRRLGGRVSAL